MVVWQCELVRYKFLTINQGITLVNETGTWKMYSIASLMLRIFFSLSLSLALYDSSLFSSFVMYEWILYRRKRRKTYTRTTNTNLLKCHHIYYKKACENRYNLLKHASVIIISFGVSSMNCIDVYFQISISTHKFDSTFTSIHIEIYTYPFNIQPLGPIDSFYIQISAINLLSWW